MDNLTMITEAVAAGFEKADIEKPLSMKLTGASRLSPAEMQQAAASRAERLAVLIDREVDRIRRVRGREGRLSKEYA